MPEDNAPNGKNGKSVGFVDRLKSWLAGAKEDIAAQNHKKNRDHAQKGQFNSAARK